MSFRLSPRDWQDNERTKADVRQCIKLEANRRDSCLGKHQLGLQASPGMPSDLVLVPFMLCPVSNTVLITVGRHSDKLMCTYAPI